MPFEALRERLLTAGIAPRHVRRYLAELNDHLDDRTQAQRDAGYDTEDAKIRARAYAEWHKDHPARAAPTTSPP